MLAVVKKCILQVRMLVKHLHLHISLLRCGFILLDCRLCLVYTYNYSRLSFAYLTGSVVPSVLLSVQTLRMLEKREKVLIKKASQEVEEAKELSRANIKRVAILCLKRKRLYEQRIEQLRYFQLPIRDQIIMLEGAKARTMTVDALRTRAAAMKAMQEAMDTINEQNETMKQVQEALSAPSGAAAVFDEDELEAELEELKGPELEEQLLLPAATASAPAPPVPQGTGKEDELADEMAF
ncbi:vacuolar protein sorting-associated protein 32 homolog 1 isoform X2 [Eucalyptus grandis]|uniref:vacuolar protein sorting-associated protein 32 homolog 1 isoform X2 n=2 Tax=Eucalyptus grandis TaxID=71139 RepID=UPI00192EC03C|nr:vacuolar protein sorting-associated protein 32 homolog 1 isoform X2 [Eucalyptus grandis]